MLKQALFFFLKNFDSVDYKEYLEKGMGRVIRKILGTIWRSPSLFIIPVLFIATISWGTARIFRIEPLWHMWINDNHVHHFVIAFFVIYLTAWLTAYLLLSDQTNKLHRIIGRIAAVLLALAGGVYFDQYDMWFHLRNGNPDKNRTGLVILVIFLSAISLIFTVVEKMQRMRHLRSENKKRSI